MTRQRSATVRVWLVLSPGVLLLDLAGIAEPLRLANRFALAGGAPVPAFDLRMVSPRARVRSSLGLEFGRLAPLPRRLRDGDWVVLVGVAGAVAAAEAAATATSALALGSWLRTVLAPQLAANRARLWTVCSGALTAAGAGLFDGRQCTTHHELIDKLAALAPAAEVLTNRIYVIDGPVASSAGITAGIDLALAAIQSACGPGIAAQVAQDLVVYWRRAGADPQVSPLLDHRNHLHAAVHRVQDAVLAEPAASWNEERLAAVAHVSPRHLRRLFTTHAGLAPLAYVSSIRVALARQHLASARMSVERAAERAGFSSARALRAAQRRVDRH